ncbi:MAG: hypothetical protein ABJC09_06275 [Terriglobia bacterium]
MAAENSFVSVELSRKIQAGLEELQIVRRQFEPLLSIPPDAEPGVIVTSAACAMLHSFYTEIEKILKIIAREWDGLLPASEAWHRDLLIQMSEPTAKRPAVLSDDSLPILKEFLAFRHLFRGASIALMRWNKLHPLVEKVESVYSRVSGEMGDFVRFLDDHTDAD